MKRWYAVYTQPQRELMACEHLERQGFEVVAPRCMKRRRHARRVEDVPAPLFPRYIFACFDAADAAWRVIRSTRGVVEIVRSGLTPLPVPVGVVEEISRRLDETGCMHLVETSRLSPGDRIRIETGPFADYEAIFQSVRDEDRVVALLSLLGREVRAEVPIEAVMPVR